MDNTSLPASAAVSDRGLSEKRPQNEDSFLKMDQCGVFAVADGVGGAQAGEVASQMAMEILAEAFTNRHDGDDAETVMRTAIERANGAIHQMAYELPQLSSMATTIVALHLADGIATIGHVGDSRLYRLDRSGILHPETADHSMVPEEVRAGRMTTEQAENHPSRNIISRALGAEATVAVDLRTIMVEPGTAFLICSDGITRHVTDQEIKGVLTFGGGPAEICEYLKDLCYERGAEDNLTAVVVKLPTAQSVTAPDEDVVPFAIESEVPTIATARVPFDEQIFEEDDDHLLELDEREVIMPSTVLEEPTVSDDDNTVPIFEERVAEPLNIVDPAAEPPLPINETVSASDHDSFSMFGNSELATEEKRTGGSALTTVAMLMVGFVIGLGVYHFALAPYRADNNAPQLSVMKSENIPLSAFEENRRNVDKDPAGYIAKFGSSPQDSEDFYLLGRAYLITADYPKARLAFTEAQNKLAEADPVNAKVLASDIAVALAVTNDTTIQSMLKKALDPGSAANTNTNR